MQKLEEEVDPKNDEADDWSVMVNPTITIIFEKKKVHVTKA